VTEGGDGRAGTVTDGRVTDGRDAAGAGGGAVRPDEEGAVPAARVEVGGVALRVAVSRGTPFFLLRRAVAAAAAPSLRARACDPGLPAAAADACAASLWRFAVTASTLL
jgi:hypothetical protein